MRRVAVWGELLYGKSCCMGRVAVWGEYGQGS